MSASGGVPEGALACALAPAEPIVPWQTASSLYKTRTQSDVTGEAVLESPRRDQFNRATCVQPKTPCNDTAYDAGEQVGRAFTPACQMGIRSLPNALHPDFRQQLWDQLMDQRDNRLASREGRSSAFTSRCPSPGKASSGRPTNSCPPSAGPCYHQNVIPSAASLAAAGLVGAAAGSNAATLAAAAAATAERMRHIHELPPPSRHNPYARFFTHFDHMVDEYSRPQEFQQIRQEADRRAQVSSDPFVHRGVSLPLYHVGTFSKFAYHSHPYMEVDWFGCSHHASSAAAGSAGTAPGSRKSLSSSSTSSSSCPRAFMPPGRARAPHLSDELRLKGACPDLLQHLKRRISKDWPRSFLQVFVNKEGGIVVSFDAAAAAAEGNLTAYMNTFVKADSLAVEFRLNKEPLKWGSSEDEGGPVFYVMRPTWAHARAEVPEQLAGPVPVWTEPPHVSNPARGFTREPFAHLSVSGVRTDFNTRLFQKTLDCALDGRGGRVRA